MAPWAHLVHRAKEVQLEEEDLRDLLVCQVYLVALEDQVGQDLQVKQELLVNLEEMANR